MPVYFYSQITIQKIILYKYLIVQYYFLYNYFGNSSMHPPTTDVAIIGAGTAGCFIASLLDEAGIDCLLIEKSRGVGGRCSHRRIDNDYGIDLGAPEFSHSMVTNPLLKEKFNSWVSKGYLSSWAKKVNRFDTYTSIDETVVTLCGAPSMNSWHKKSVRHINILMQTKAYTIRRVEGFWHLLDESNKVIVVAKKIVITTPPEQAIDLLNTLNNYSYCHTLPTNSLPQYVCAVGFTKRFNAKADFYQGGHALLHNAIRENSKPGRVCPAPLEEVWVLHSTYDWAQQQHHAESGVAAIQLVAAFCQHFGIEAEPHILTSHYWRMAQYKKASQENVNYTWDSAFKIGCCGNWLAGGGTFGAISSALALHQQMLTQCPVGKG